MTNDICVKSCNGRATSRKFSESERPMALLVRGLTMRPRPAAAIRAARPVMGPPSGGSAATWAAWAAYCGVVLFSEGGIAPGASALHTEPATIKEALDLSLNFFFVLPTIASSVAPVVDPSLEAFFNVLICWALLFFGFAADEKENSYPGGMLPYLTGALFLTNVFYLPMLALRSPRSDVELREATAAPLTPLQRLAESRVLAGVIGVAVPLLALAWFGFARPEMLSTGFEARWDALVNLISTDRLAFSFAADYLIFALFQGALVNADAERRGVDSSNAGVAAARFVPFAGLVAWLLTRPALEAGAWDEQ